MQNKFIWSIIAGVVSGIIFTVTYYDRFCNFALANSLIGVAASMFALVLNTVLVIQLANLDASKMGDLKEEKATIILALTLFIIYTSLSVIETYYNVYKLPIQTVCKTP
jgi:hypothetical protein